jgi:hypothetical protein
MLRNRLCVVAAALVIGLAGGIAMLAPAAQASNSGNTFMYYPDINTNHQWCLGITSSKNGVLATCTYIHDQAWHRGKEAGHSSYYQWINAYGQCLGVAGGSKKKGARIVGARCGGSSHPDQYWAIDYAGTETYLCTVFNYHSGYVMQPVSNKKNAAVVQEPWKGHRNSAQEWVFEINS